MRSGLPRAINCMCRVLQEVGAAIHLLLGITGRWRASLRGLTGSGPVCIWSFYLAVERAEAKAGRCFT